MGEDPQKNVEDLLKMYDGLGVNGQVHEALDSLGINGPVFEALQCGDLQTAVWSMLLEQNQDPLLATVMQFMLARNHAVPAGTAGAEQATGQPLARLDSSDTDPSDTAATRSENGQVDGVHAALRHVTLMLGACPACCGEEASCPACHGNGKPGSLPSIASAHELRAWIEPALGRMGMHITNPALAAAAADRKAQGPQA